jgi:hypothetical protein
VRGYGGEEVVSSSVRQKGTGTFSEVSGQEITGREEMKLDQIGFRFEIMPEEIAIAEGKGWWGIVEAAFGHV